MESGHLIKNKSRNGRVISLIQPRPQRRAQDKGLARQVGHDGNQAQDLSYHEGKRNAKCLWQEEIQGSFQRADRGRRLNIVARGFRGRAVADGASSIRRPRPLPSPPRGACFGRLPHWTFEFRASVSDVFDLETICAKLVRATGIGHILEPCQISGSSVRRLRWQTTTFK